jgi:uncharacterized protein (DUF305 family)
MSQHQHRRNGAHHRAIGILFTCLLLVVFGASVASGPVAAQERVPDFVPDRRAAQVEQDFLMGMIPHHRGAITMSQMALEKATKPELREFAQKVIDAQSVEVQVMTNYLRDWYGMTPPAGDMMPADMMAKMNMPMAHGTMPNMQAMMKQMQVLQQSTGADFDIAYMSILSEHHSMAVMMASTALIGSYHGDLYKMAAKTVTDQGEEIEQLQMWLETWYNVPRPRQIR